MGRLGERDPGRADRARPRLRRGPAASSWPASGPTSPPPTSRTPSFFDEQLERFAAVAERGHGELAPACTVHAANSAATLREPALPLRHGPLRRRGLRPRPLPARPRRAGPRAGARAALLRRRRQALRARARAPATGGPGGRREDTWVGVLPIGYGDGVRRGLSNNAEVLVGGRRYPLVGTVSMDNITDRPRARDRRRARAPRRC